MDNSFLELIQFVRDDIRMIRLLLLAFSFTFLAACGGSGSTSNEDTLQPVQDTTPPTISLNGDAKLTIEAGSDYTELGATASDNVDGQVDVSISGSVDIMTVGTYTLTYTASDKAGNVATATRTVSVVDTSPPTLTLTGGVELTLEGGTDYQEQGATANDNVDGQVDVSISGTVDTMTLGIYTLTYTASDKAGNQASVKRIISVVDTTPPILTLNGDEQIEHVLGRDYLDKGAVAFDAVDGEVPFTVSGEVDVMILGDYTLTYRATDLSGNSASVERMVTIREEKPLIIRWQISSRSLTTTLLANPEYTYDYTIDWGDGHVDTNVTGDITHSYASEGEYEVSIRGTCPHFRFQRKYDEWWCLNCDVIRAVVQWGDIQWRDMTGFFNSQRQFIAIETDQSPDLTQVSSLSAMFTGTQLNGDISQWDVSNVTDMSSMFQAVQSMLISPSGM